MAKDEPVKIQVEKQIEFLAETLRQQAMKGWPRCFVFPLPTGSIEREALCSFIASIEAETGLPVQLHRNSRISLSLVIPSCPRIIDGGR